MGKILVISFILLVGCTKFQSDLSSARGNFEYANHLLNSKQYNLALEAFQDVKKYSNQEYITKADLKIADIYFILKSYEEALYTYKRFQEFYPTHKKSDYVSYQIALCYYNRLPRSADRDLSLAYALLDALDLLINNYPNFEKINEVKSKKIEIRNLLAQKELGIANFYLKNKQYKSALARYIAVTNFYHDTGAAPASLLGAGKAHLGLDNKIESKKYLDKLLKEYTASEESIEAAKIIEENGF